MKITIELYIFKLIYNKSQNIETNSSFHVK